MKTHLKIALLIACHISVCFSARAQEASFTITVKMNKPMDGYKAFLRYVKVGDDKPTTDSAAYIDGKFELKGKTPQVQKALLYVERGNRSFVANQTKYGLPLYLEKGNIMVNAAEIIKGAKLSGTLLNNDLQAFVDVQNSTKVYQDSLSTRFGKAYHDKDSVSLKRLSGEFAELKKVQQKKEENYFYSHLNSLVSLDWLKQNVNIAQSKAHATEMFGKLTTTLKNSPNGKEYAKLLAATSSVAMGAKAPDFTSKDIKGKDVSLSSFRGQYVLLDFWASWCGPCRKENPNVVKAYNSFKAKNFTVISFSMDESKKAWEYAVEKDALPWTQLSDLLAFNAGIGKLYGISAIPSNFLIDPQGKIIALDLRGDALEKELSKILKM